MRMQRASRRHAVVVIVFVWLLVCGGLAWATRSAIRLEAVESHAALEHTRDEAVKLEVARLDQLIAEAFARESIRPYEHFRAFFIPARPLDAPGGATYKDPIWLPSPLSEASGPEWIVLHFQASETEGWSSPELSPGAELATPAGAFPAPQRARRASPENWLAALKERYTPGSLQILLEQALASAADLNPAIEAADPAAQPLKLDAEAPGAPASRLGDSPAATSDEFVRRGRQMLELQRANFPAEQCEPEMVALQNLQADPGGPDSDAYALRDDDGNRCVPVHQTRMMPLWLDLTGDADPSAPCLALVRSVSVETSRYCTLQGVLIDWGRLRNVLESQARARFPGASLVPIRPVYNHRRDESTTAEADASGLNALRTIPARLDTGEEPETAPFRLSTSLRNGLGLAWGVTLLALLAITYGTAKYVAMTERRLKFVAAVTHELRTPLTSFQLYSDLLSDMPKEDAGQRRRYAGVLRGESSRLCRLVENVLAYSRVGAEKPVLQEETIPPAALLDAVVNASKDCCAAAGKQIVVEDACRDVSLRTDPQFIVQILTNLIENACRYAVNAADHRIWLSAAVGAGGDVVFEVDDAGPGVPPSQRRAVFEPFRRGTTGNGGPHAPAAAGIGLGLSLSRYWAECLGGTLQVKRSPRNGAHFSCFELRLPPGVAQRC